MPFIIPGKLTPGDEVRIASPYDSYDEHNCRHCDEDIGWDDYEMDEFIGRVVKVENFPRYRYEPRCGAEVFTYDDWLWTTCWIDGWWPSTTNRTPDWEV